MAGEPRPEAFPFWGKIALPACALWGTLFGVLAGYLLGNMAIGAAIGAALGIGLGLSLFAAAVVIASAHF
jgi:hypothetical protein